MTNDSIPTEVSSDDRLWAALAYVFSPLVPIILLLWEDKKDRPYIRANNVQALILGVISILTSAFCIGILVWFYQLFLAYKAYQGEEVVVPVITDLVRNQGWA